MMGVEYNENFKLYEAFDISCCRCGSHNCRILKYANKDIDAVLNFIKQEVKNRSE